MMEGKAEHRKQSNNTGQAEHFPRKQQLIQARATMMECAPEALSLPRGNSEPMY